MVRAEKFPPLCPGDSVALVAPAGPVEAERVEGATALLERAGFSVAARPDVTDRTRYLAGSDARRLAELTEAMTSPSIKAVFLARGGYGTQRIARSLPGKIDAPPKPVVGFSDNTALHSLIANRYGWCTLHGPHPDPDTPEELDEVLACLTSGHMPVFEGLTPIEGRKGRGRVDGKISAAVTGGCLAILSSSVGTECFPATAGRILFLEDVAEPPYRLDRMLNHLLCAGHVCDAAAVVFGEPAAFVPDGVDLEEVMHVIEDFAAQIEAPVLTGLPCGHVKSHRPLPFGPEAVLDPVAGTLRFIEGLTV